MSSEGTDNTVVTTVAEENVGGNAIAVEEKVQTPGRSTSGQIDLVDVNAEKEPPVPPVVTATASKTQASAPTPPSASRGGGRSRAKPTPAATSQELVDSITAGMIQDSMNLNSALIAELHELSQRYKKASTNSIPIADRTRLMFLSTHVQARLKALASLVELVAAANNRKVPVPLYKRDIRMAFDPRHFNKKLALEIWESQDKIAARIKDLEELKPAPIEASVQWIREKIASAPPPVAAPAPVAVPRRSSGRAHTPGKFVEADTSDEDFAE